MLTNINQKKYCLYSIRIINAMPMYTYVNSVFAANILEAEMCFENEMMSGIEYQITISKL